MRRWWLLLTGMAFLALFVLYKEMMFYGNLRRASFWLLGLAPQVAQSCCLAQAYRLVEKIISGFNAMACSLWRRADLGMREVKTSADRVATIPGKVREMMVICSWEQLEVGKVG
jgi:hypothetical protein